MKPGNTVTKFNELLNDYFEKGFVKDKGLPTANYMASQLNLSTRYQSDLLKQETGKTPIDLIHLYLIAEAKNLLAGGDLSVSEIAYALGFENPAYFSRLGFEGFFNVNNFESIQGKSAIALNLNTLEKFESILILNGKTFTFSPFFYNPECTLVRYFIRFVGFSQD